MAFVIINTNVDLAPTVLIPQLGFEQVQELSEVVTIGSLI